MKTVENMNLIIEKLNKEVHSDYCKSKTLINTYGNLLRTLEREILYKDIDYKLIKALTSQFNTLTNISGLVGIELAENLKSDECKNAFTLSHIKKEIVSVLQNLKHLTEQFQLRHFDTNK